MEKIDFVMIWVDGSDPEWVKEKNAYLPARNNKMDVGEERYRDWDNLRYWFRGVEKFAPWVNKIHFVTCGQIPEWLNLENPKLNFIRHTDYMPTEFLPTFSSHPIELNLHRIDNLSDKFIYFNDDMFLINSVQPELFFRNNLPVHPAVLHAILPLHEGNSEIMSHIYVNMVTAINRHFNAKKSISENKIKWFAPWNCGIKNSVMSLFNAQHLEFVGFYNEHLPVPMLKSTMNEVWANEYNLLYETSCRKFRSSDDVSQYLFRHWDLASGNFEPIKPNDLGHRFTLHVDCENVCTAIKTQKYKMVCLNESSEEYSYEQFEEISTKIKQAFNEILPNKSSFEK